MVGNNIIRGVNRVFSKNGLGLCVRRLLLVAQLVSCCLKVKDYLMGIAINGNLPSLAAHCQ